MIICRSVRNSLPAPGEGRLHRVTPAIVFDRSLLVNKETTRRDWITSLRVTTHRLKDVSRALTLRMPELIQAILKAGILMPTLGIDQQSSLIQTVRQSRYVTTKADVVKSQTRMQTN